MAIKRSSLLNRGGFLKRAKSIKKMGSRGLTWQKFRNDQFEKDKDEEGLIRCEDNRIGLPQCGISRSEMDLHHVEGRDGNLLTDRSKMVWLTRECHNEAHN